MQYQLSTVNLSRSIDSPNAANPAVYEDISPQCIEITDGRSKPIRRAVNAATARIHDVSVHHRCAHVCVQESLCSIAYVHFIDSNSGFPYTQAVSEFYGSLEGGLANYDAGAGQFL
jgi:hypothetical protein